MAEVIHYGHNGDSQKVFSPQGTYKVLFAEYFRPRMVYSLLGHFSTMDFHSFEITIVASEAAKIAEIQDTDAFCMNVLGMSQYLILVYPSMQ